MPSSETVYRINDALTAMASELNLLDSTMQGDEAALDAALNEATWQVVGVFFPDEQAELDNTRRDA